MDKSKRVKQVLERKKENSLHTCRVFIHGRQIKSNTRNNTIYIYKKKNDQNGKINGNENTEKSYNIVQQKQKNIDALLKLNQIIFS